MAVTRYYGTSRSRQIIPQKHEDPTLLLYRLRKLATVRFIDSSVPYDTRVDSKEAEETEKFQDLARELKNLWNMTVHVIPVVMGMLRTPPR